MELCECHVKALIETILGFQPVRYVVFSHVTRIKAVRAPVNRVIAQLDHRTTSGKREMFAQSINRRSVSKILLH